MTYNGRDERCRWALVVQPVNGRWLLRDLLPDADAMASNTPGAVWVERFQTATGLCVAMAMQPRETYSPWLIVIQRSPWCSTVGRSAAIQALRPPSMLATFW
jgi:hypothetical protein